METTLPTRRTSRERWTVALLLSLLLLPLLAVLATPFLPSPLLALGMATVLVAIACPRIARALPHEWDGLAAQHPALSAAWLLLALLAVARSAGVAWFMADPEQAQASAFWFDEFYIRHSCVSGLWKGAELAIAGTPNIYHWDHYAGFEGRFKLDEFMYLPQFLILPATGIALGGAFLDLRAIWFALESGIVAGAMLVLCAFAGGSAGRRAGLLLPAVWLATPTLLTLQVGNFQLAAIALCVLAMIAFERGRPVLGGALFGFTLFKIFPGLLGIYLLVRRQWAAAAWTAVFAFAYTGIAWAWFGNAPFQAFLEFQLPRIVTGDAWGFLENEGLGAVVAINDSVPGIVLKLKMLGLAGMDRALQNGVALAWVLVCVALTVLAALRAPRQSALERGAAWIALLALASFRSPFIPDHSGLFAPMWLWTLAAVTLPASPLRIAALAIAALALSAVLPFSGMPLPDEMGRLALSSFSQAVALLLCLWVALRRPSLAGSVAVSKPESRTSSSALPPVTAVAASSLLSSTKAVS